jgi:hypothetical protein
VLDPTVGDGCARPRERFDVNGFRHASGS